MAEADLYPRHAAPHLVEALQDSPVVLIHGPRQCGKTTLARMTGEPRGYVYISFDDDVVREAAATDPAGFVADLSEHVILDEVQRAPAIFAALKMAVDRRRTAGRFMLTGSSQVLLVPKLTDSLAGRMEILRLHPLSQSELAREQPRFLDALFSIAAADSAARTTGAFETTRIERLAHELAERIAAGGYPPALTRPPGRRRASWHRDYVDALVQRDIRDLAHISALDALPRLLALAAAQTARLFNLADLASPFGLSRPTIRDYVTLLERVFLLERLPPWHGNRSSRLVKTPKLHFGDTGLACALLGTDAAALAADRTLLGFVLRDLRVPGTAAAGDRPRHPAYVLPLPRQGPRGGRCRHRTWHAGAGGRGSQGRRHGEGIGLPRPAQAQERGRGSFRGRRGTVRR